MDKKFIKCLESWKNTFVKKIYLNFSKRFWTSKVEIFWGLEKLRTKFFAKFSTCLATRDLLSDSYRVLDSRIKHISLGTVKPRNMRYPNARISCCAYFFCSSFSITRIIAALTPDACMFSQLHLLTIETSQNIV